VDATQTTPTPVTIIQEPGTNVPYDAAFSPGDSVVVTAGTDGTAREWNARTGRQLLTLVGHSGSVSAVAFSGTEILTASSDGTARIWGSEPIEQRGLLPGPSGQQIITAAFSPASPRIVATANGNGTVSIWNTSNQKAPIKVLPVPGAASAQFSTNGSLLATAGHEQVRIWAMSNLGRPAKVLDTSKCPKSNGNAPTLDGATFNDDGNLVVTADADGSACAWNISNGDLVQAFTEPASAGGGGLGVRGSAMRWAVFSPDGKQVLTASSDGTARLWDVGSGRQHQVFSEPTGNAINDAWFSPSGTQIVTASNDGTARTWSAATGAVLQTLNGPGRNPVDSAAFSRDGKLVVTCSGSAAVIWNTLTGEQVTQFQYGNAFSDCEFSPDGREVVAAGDGQTRIFSTELTGGLEQIRRIAEQRATQPLTAAELKEYQADISQSP
jgi:WD40 repeat protein